MNWVRGEKLGRGSFATVNLAVPKSQSSGLPPLMAVKSCGISSSSSLMSEKLILEELKDCPEIIRCFGESFSYENGEKLYNVLLEYASGGSLADKLKNSCDRRLPEFEVRQYTKALLKGLRYIHNSGYVHCDIKLQNILLCRNGVVKIADFGLAKRGPAADIWALGCVAAEMLTGSPAWRCSDVASLLMKIGVGDELPEIPKNLSSDGKDFLGKCFVKDPSKRWTAEMLLNHPFICDQDFEDEINTASTSPRCPFDFPDNWESSVTCSITSLTLPEYSRNLRYLGVGGPLRRRSGFGS
ncbi:hypothetical protein DH2020_037575 [Rehmannia glutinosa]|uniref:Protein kinase domain-containing protein n=1 Tax=Rehmannia glutinosa TaxID=99300 RepID=A0ABR0V181_REHGL